MGTRRFSNFHRCIKQESYGTYHLVFVVFNTSHQKKEKKGISKALPQSVVIGNEWYGDTPS
jgi:hypothetical protein